MSHSDAYQLAALALLDESGCTVRAWRKRATGVAYTRSADWGIEVPTPTTARRFGVFAHEVGHQVLHRDSHRQRWLEEVEAWEYALEQFDRFDLDGREHAQHDAESFIAYAVRKALRRSTKRLELLERIADRADAFVTPGQVERFRIDCVLEAIWA